ncbi:MAG TPA: aminotransferase class I/II-fold pyridoxal phosphate-dependent enzyme [Woeseiaceae bacterium]|nr:aminotransferase class I/II-fold pyridoxal phosphate-dependent enzyme [Woeseiaceae bacterium]
MNRQTENFVSQAVERSLDPENWDELRELGHRALDDMIDYLQTVRDRPVWQPLPESARRLFAMPLPQHGLGASAVYDRIRKEILPYPTGNIHPRFWSWVGGTGTANQLVADLVISAMNSAGLGFDEVASTHVELQLLGWLKEMLGYPAGASGLLVSGGSMANLVGLAVARNRQSGGDVRKRGLQAADESPLVFYASSETHSSVRKAVELLGIGSEWLHTVPVLNDFTIDMAALREAIDRDRRRGYRPACIVANVGTVNTGAIDPLPALAELACAEQLWLHADAAFGAFARMSPGYRHLVEGLERADSLAFDLHKWLYVQYDCGCVLVRDGNAHRDTFSVLPAYLRNLDRGLASGPVNFSEYGVQLSRSFRALRAWTGLLSEGAQRYAEQIEQNIRQARYLDGLVAGHAELELLAPTALNIVNFRYVAPALENTALDDLNAEILMTLQERGIAAPSSTVLNGRFSLRVAICNHRSRREDFDILVANVVSIAHELTRKAASR